MSAVETVVRATISFARALQRRMQQWPEGRVSQMTEADRERFFSALCDTQFDPQRIGDLSLCRDHWRAAKQEQAQIQTPYNSGPNSPNSDPNVVATRPNVVQFPLNPIQLVKALEPPTPPPVFGALI